MPKRSGYRAIVFAIVILAGSAPACSAGSSRGEAAVANNSAHGVEQVTVDSSEVAVASCTVDVNAFPQTHLLKVRATLILTSKKDGIARLAFGLRDQFKVDKIAQADKPLRFSQSKGDITVEGIQVAQNSPPIVWEYQGTFKPPFKSDSMGDVIVYADEIRLTYTSHWYPKPLWSSQPAIRPSSKLSVEVPEGFTVVSSDRQEHAPLPHDGRVLYQYASLTHGSLSFAAAKYAKTAVPWGDKTVEAYFFPRNPGQKPTLAETKLPQEEKDVLETLKIAKDILDFYSRKFGQYPWPRFALVQKSNYAAYAYGAQSYVVMNSLTNIDEQFFAHEIAHQWWANLVHPVGRGERWLTESLAEYSAFLYMEHAHGSTEVVRDGREFLLRQMQNMCPIRKTSFDTPDYDNIVYKIGPYIFHMLRYIVGDEQFFVILKTFTEEYANKDATVDDFIKVAERTHKKSLGWFFNEWLDKTKNPAFVLKSEIAELPDGIFSVKGTITQHNTDYQMPLEIEIVGKDQKEKHLIPAEGSATPFEYRVSYKPSQVRFAEEMRFWVLADFFHSEQERLAALETKPRLPAARSYEELFQRIRNKITLERSYTLGTEIELELEADQAARLDCAENPYGYKEILICPMEGVLYVYTFYTDGSSSGGGRRLAEGFNEHGRSMQVRNVIVWEIKTDKVHIRFRTETDEQKIKQLIKEKCQKRDMTPEQIEKILKQSFPQ